jgi:plasmid maintenance system antidote protein VapI
MHICFDSRLVRLELVKRGWQLSDLATQAGLSEPTARAVVRGRGVSMVTALKVVRALERNPPNERLMALLNWHEAHPRPVVPSQMVTASDR